MNKLKYFIFFLFPLFVFSSCYTSNSVSSNKLIQKRKFNTGLHLSIRKAHPINEIDVPNEKSTSKKRTIPILTSESERKLNNQKLAEESIHIVSRPIENVDSLIDIRTSQQKKEQNPDFQISTADVFKLPLIPKQLPQELKPKVSETNQSHGKWMIIFGSTMFILSIVVMLILRYTAGSNLIGLISVFILIVGFVLLIVGLGIKLFRREKKIKLSSPNQLKSHSLELILAISTLLISIALVLFFSAAASLWGNALSNAILLGGAALIPVLFYFWFRQIKIKRYDWKQYKAKMKGVTTGSIE